MASVGDEDDVQKSTKKISKLFGPIFNDFQRAKRIFGKSGNMNHPTVEWVSNVTVLYCTVTLEARDAYSVHPVYSGSISCIRLIKLSSIFPTYL